MATSLSKPWFDWCLRPHFQDTLDLLSERDAKRYRLQRRLIGRTYHASNMAKFEEVIDAVLDRVVETLGASQGKDLDLTDWMHIVAVECLGACVLSWSPGMLRDGTDWGTISHSYQGWRRKSVFGLFPLATKLDVLSPDFGRAFGKVWGVTYKTPRGFKAFFPVSSGPQSRTRQKPDAHANTGSDKACLASSPSGSEAEPGRRRQEGLACGPDPTSPG